MFHVKPLGGYSETVYRYMEGAGEFYAWLEKDWEED